MFRGLGAGEGGGASFSSCDLIWVRTSTSEPSPPPPTFSRIWQPCCSKCPRDKRCCTLRCQTKIFLSFPSSILWWLKQRCLAMSAGTCWNSERKQLIFSFSTFSFLSLSLHHSRLSVAGTKAYMPKIRTLFCIVLLKKHFLRGVGMLPFLCFDVKSAGVAFFSFHAQQAWRICTGSGPDPTCCSTRTQGACLKRISCASPPPDQNSNNKHKTEPLSNSTPLSESTTHRCNITTTRQHACSLTVKSNCKGGYNISFVPTV